MEANHSVEILLTILVVAVLVIILQGHRIGELKYKLAIEKNLNNRIFPQKPRDVHEDHWKQYQGRI